jgi:dTDP-4-amino-4,6-dideoxygalactose transaminase
LVFLPSRKKGRKLNPPAAGKKLRDVIDPQLNNQLGRRGKRGRQTPTQAEQKIRELATDTHRHTQTFLQRTSLDKNSHRFAKKMQNKLYKARVIGGEVAEDLFDRGLCLPSGTAMTEGDLERVVETILNCKK